MLPSWSSGFLLPGCRDTLSLGSVRECCGELSGAGGLCSPRCRSAASCPLLGVCGLAGLSQLVIILGRWQVAATPGT